MNAEKTGKLIHDLRIEKGLTQQDLAEALNMTPTAISKWENGHSLPDISMLEPLSDALGVSITEIVLGEISPLMKAENTTAIQVVEDAPSDIAIKSVIDESIIQRKKSIRRIICLSLLSVVAIIALFLLLSYHGYPIKSDDLSLQTEFQYNDGAYLDQSFVLHIIRLDGNPLNVSVKNVYEQDEHGKDYLVGYIVKPYKVLFNLGQHPGGYTIGYTYNGTTAPADNKDFIITVELRDKTIEYSMQKEGLYIPQENVVHYGE